MEKKPDLDGAWEFFRTAPLGETIILLNLATLVMDLIANDPTYYYKFAGAALGALLTLRQFALRHRLEKSVQEYGYTDRAFGTTTHEWCARQTALVVADNCGNRAEYLQLCLRNREEMELPFVPNF